MDGESVGRFAGVPKTRLRKGDFRPGMVGRQPIDAGASSNDAGNFCVSTWYRRLGLDVMMISMLIVLARSDYATMSLTTTMTMMPTTMTTRARTAIGVPWLLLDRDAQMLTPCDQFPVW